MEQDYTNGDVNNDLYIPYESVIVLLSTILECIKESPSDNATEIVEEAISSLNAVKFELENGYDIDSDNLH